MSCSKQGLSCFLHSCLKLKVRFHQIVQVIDVVVFRITTAVRYLRLHFIPRTTRKIHCFIAVQTQIEALMNSFHFDDLGVSASFSSSYTNEINDYLQAL